MKRRGFIITLGAAVAIAPSWLRAQSAAKPVIGFLSSRSAADSAGHLAAFLQGLKAFGYVEGDNLTIEYRWANGEYERLPALARELIALDPAAIVAAGGVGSARAARSATSTIPILFAGGDPVQAGLVASLNRPGGNLSGVDIMTGELGGKRLELLLQMVPDAEVVGFLTNPQGPDTYLGDAREAADARGRRFVVVGASVVAELETAFSRLAESGAKALIVGNDPFFDAIRDRLIALAAQHAIPAIYHIREFPAEGGLMSYGASLVGAYRQLGIQTGRVLKGANPAELAVVRPTQFELVINLQTAKALGLTVPPTLFAQADEVIE
ncbi:MAG TPA: ABC transporter substrate-binding protein [Stellaceae bacterium]|nr:ABC transporter substrate-binding protein [Stellaceae bacterium]